MARPILALVVGAAWLGVIAWWALTSDVEGWSWRRIAYRWTFEEFQTGLLLTLAVAAGSAVLLARNRGEAALRVALVAGAVGLTAGLLELPAALGLVDYGKVVGLPDAIRFTRMKPWENPSNVTDPELVYRRRPGHAFSGEVAGDLVMLYGIATDRRYRVDVRYDGEGFRNAATPERVDVAVIGDSFVEAGLVPYEETLPVQLGRRLGAPVANLGQSGFGPLQERIVLERYALPLQPRQVVWLFFEGNDLLDDARFERFRREQHRPPSSGFRSRSLFAQLLPRLALATSGGREEDSPKARSRRGRCGDEHVYFAYVGRPLPEAEEAALADVQETLLDARRLTEAHGAEFLLVYVPFKYRVYRDLCVFPPESEPSEWTLNDLPERMAAWACGQELPFLDLTPSLRDAAARGTPPFFADDGHWNAAGQAVAADAIAASLAGDPPVCAPADRALTPAGGPRTGAARP